MSRKRDMPSFTIWEERWEERERGEGFMSDLTEKRLQAGKNGNREKQRPFLNALPLFTDFLLYEFLPKNHTITPTIIEIITQTMKYI